MEELRKHARSKTVARDVIPDIEAHASFLKARSEATTTMVKSLPTSGGSSPSAIVIGAGHTAKTMKYLRGKHPYVVLAGDSYGDLNDRSKLSPEEYNLRSDGKPLREGGLSVRIFSALRKKGKKPQPGLTFDYIRAENELDTILFLASAGGGGSQSPPNGPADPRSWFNSDGGYEGEFWKVLASSLAWVDKDGNVVAKYETLEGVKWDSATQMLIGATALVFDLQLRAADGLVYTAKVAASAEGSQLQETIANFRKNFVETVETELLAARNSLLKGENRYPTNQGQTHIDQRKPSWNVNAMIGNNRDAVCIANFQ